MKLRHLFLLASLLLFGFRASAQQRYVFGTKSYTDSSGHLWSPIPISAMSGVQGTNWRASTCAPGLTDPLYKQQYLFLDPKGVADTITVAVPQGTYTVNMYFEDPCSGSGVGLRQFSLQFNGTMIDPSLDIVKEAGGAQKPLIKTGSITGSSLVVTIIDLKGGSNPPFAALEILPAGPVVTSVSYTQTVNGTGFVQGSVVEEGGVACPTVFVSTIQLTAQCLPGTGAITVVNPTVAHSVKLSWTASNSPGVTGYSVLRSTTTGSGYTAIGSTSTTSFTDSTVSGGTTYFYVVQAVSPNGHSANSNQYTGVIPSP